MKEFKVLEFKKDKKDAKTIEQTLEQKTSEGWEVVSMTVDLSRDLRGIIVVLLQREKKASLEA